ncbi:MAG TPA: hypothetical protein PLL53_08695 [Saprospiraceae bacterium]|nr:hypothetical protein [Saprospiraceae bacterium]
MKNTFFLLFATTMLLLSSCGNKTASTAVQPDAETAQLWLNRIIRYTAHLPGKASHETKFDTIHNAFYAEQTAKYRVEYYHQNGADHYLLVSRPAPSLKVKRVGIGIHARMAGDSLAHYNEVFRTWKMEEPQLAQKGALLFNLMVQGEDLSPYYTQNSGQEEYIEFPDAHTSFDTLRRQWVSTLSDPLAPYRGQE